MADTLDSIMRELQSRVNSEDTVTKVGREEIEQLKEEVVVVMPAGGKGTRIRAETQSDEINKVMIPVDGERSMIQKAVEDYASTGIKHFVVLTGFLADAVENHLGDGSQWGVEIKYSRDPHGRKVGSAGAILNSILNGTLDEKKTAIVHNPDDVIIGTNRPYGEVFLEGHLKALKNRCISTFVVVPETPYQYSGMIIKGGHVRDITKYPPITIPAHTGITVFDPAIYRYFREMVSLEKESSFENVISPVLASENLLFAINIPSQCWIPVNDLKGLEKVRLFLRHG